MYSLTSPGNKRPVYERNGMRMDLSITDPKDPWSTGQRRFELSDTFMAEQGRDTYNYHMAFMFPDEFNPAPERFLIHQFKHGSPCANHSPPVSLMVEGEQMYFLFRHEPTGWDQSEEQAGHIRIVRNRWYEFDQSIRWSSDRMEYPFFRVTCNGQPIINRNNTPNCYEGFDTGLRHRIGPYIWNWNTLKTQTIFARL